MLSLSVIYYQLFDTPIVSVTSWFGEIAFCFVFPFFLFWWSTFNPHLWFQFLFWFGNDTWGNNKYSLVTAKTSNGWSGSQVSNLVYRPFVGEQRLNHLT